MVCKIADFYIDIKYNHEVNDLFFADYVYDGERAADFKIEVTNADIDKEEQNFAEIDPSMKFSRDYLERLAILRKFSAEVLPRDAFLIHGAFIEYEGRGYLFLAKSGTGKTTHILLWKKFFGDENVRVVNGDKPIVRYVDGKFYAYGTPWCGKENLNINTRCELSAICFVQRGAENRIERIDEGNAISRLFSQIMITDSTNLAHQLELVGALVESVPMYQLECNMHPDAARVAYNGMKE